MISQLYQFARTLITDPKLYQYALVGGICALIDLSLFFTLKAYLPWHYLIVATLSFFVATLFNFLLCSKVVFKASTRFNTSASMTLTYMVSSVGLLIHHTILFAGVETLALSLPIAKVLAMGGAFGWNFLSRRHFVFAT